MPQNNDMPNFEVLHMPPENTNSVLVTHGNDAVIFDAWGRVADWEKLLTARGLRLRAIYSTHGHGDHISAAPMLAEKYNIPWFLNSEDDVLISWSNNLLKYFGLPEIENVYYFPEFGILLTGDTLFRDSCGRYDLPGGDANALMQSVSKLYEMNLPNETYVVHGHGVDSTISQLKAENPYFK